MKSSTDLYFAVLLFPLKADLSRKFDWLRDVCFRFVLHFQKTAEKLNGEKISTNHYLPPAHFGILFN